MPRTRIGQVSDDERDEIRRLHERRTGLYELLLTVDSPDLSPEEQEALRTSIDEDLVRTNARFEGWWQRAGGKYNLEGAGHGRWMLNFETNELWHEPADLGHAYSECAPEGCDCC